LQHGGTIYATPEIIFCNIEKHQSQHLLVLLMMRDIEHDAELGLPIWDSRQNTCDRTHLMPVVTPAYPCMKCTYNVSEPTQPIIAEQMRASHQAR
jgi:poly(A) polymerase